MGLIKVTSTETSSAGDWKAAVNRVKLKALDKAKILKTVEVKILTFKNIVKYSSSTTTRRFETIRQDNLLTSG